MSRSRGDPLWSPVSGDSLWLPVAEGGDRAPPLRSSASQASQAAFLVVLLISVPAGAQPQQEPHSPPPLLLISIDGFRWDYLDIFDAPNLESLARSGVRSAGLIPVFPTKTFPNHYTAVTGLYPQHHGIVGNVMSDPELGRFSLSDRRAVQDSRWWQGEPIWVTAEKQGVRTATCFWPGSEAEIGGVRPTHWLRYDSDFANTARVELVFEWLDLPAERRPRLLTLYFGAVDSAAHRTGPTSDETRRAVAEVDRMIGLLVAGLRERGLMANMHILVISDHGMAETPAGQTVFLEDYLDLTGYDISGATPTMFLRPPAGKETEALAALDRAHPRLRAIRSSDSPERWHFRRHPRIPPIIAMTDEGWNLRATRSPAAEPRGMHGYDPRLPSMHGIFIGHGPGLVAGRRTGEIEMIDIYELMCHLLGLDPAPNDGSLEAAGELLAAPR